MMRDTAGYGVGTIRGKADVDDDTQIAAAQRIHEKARHLRGRFLNSVAVIERDIALILTDYFCTSDPVKRELFFRYVVTSRGFALSAKKEALVAIVKGDYARYWDKQKKILRTLDEIMTFRNKLAHSVVDVSHQALARPIDEGIGFVDWNGGTPITDKEFQDWVVKTNMVSGCLKEIKNLLPFKEHR
jgi:hypothetical protein